MAMWGMLLWVVEYAKSNRHGLDGLRGHWRPLEAARPRPRIFFQIWACGVCYYGLLNAPSQMGERERDREREER